MFFGIRSRLVFIITVASAAGFARAQFPDTLWIPVTYYDFRADGSNPNFEPVGITNAEGGLKTGMVLDTLNVSRKPVFRQNLIYNDRLNDWYRPSGIGGTTAAFSIDPLTGLGTWSDLANYQGRPAEWVGRNWSSAHAMKNIVLYDSLPFTLLDIRNGMYRYRDEYFLPIDGRGFGMEPASYPAYMWYNTDNNNFGFSMELRRDFAYREGLSFVFTGDDDVWGFINKRLVMDLGGIHPPLTRTVDLSTLGLTPGTIYSFDLFFAERHVSASSFALSANFLLAPYTVIALVPVASPTWDRQPMLRWRPGELSVTYTVEISTSPSFSSVIQRASIRDTVFQPSMLPLGPMYWRVRADNAAFTAPGLFTVLAADVPVLVPVKPDPTIAQFVNFTWLRPPSSSDTYQLEVSSSGSFASLVWDTAVTDTTCINTQPLAIGTYFWRVRGVGGISSVDTFQVVADTVPRLVRYDGGTVTTALPSLAWHPVFGADSYRVEYANNQRFHRSTVVVLSDTSTLPLAPLSGTTWFWRVSSSRNHTLLSDIDSFVVDLSTGTSLRGQTADDVERYRAVARDGIIFCVVPAGNGRLRVEILELNGRAVHSVCVDSDSPRSAAVRLGSARGGCFVVRVIDARGAMVWRGLIAGL